MTSSSAYPEFGRSDVDPVAEAEYEAAYETELSVIRLHALIEFGICALLTVGAIVVIIIAPDGASFTMGRGTRFDVGSWFLLVPSIFGMLIGLWGYNSPDGMYASSGAARQAIPGSLAFIALFAVFTWSLLH